MKTNGLILMLIMLSTLCFGQDAPAGNSYFVALYTIGERWDTNLPPMEQPYFKEHSAHLSQLRKDSVIVMGARYSDTGMIIIKARTLEYAEYLLREDKAIKNQLFRLEVHPYLPFYKGCLE